jgi:hypothetical protein
VRLVRSELQVGDMDIEPVSIVYGRAIQLVLMRGAQQPDALLENYRAWMET